MNRRANPRNPTQDTLIVTSTSATPKKGVPIFSKDKALSEEQRAFIERCERCPGSKYYQLVIPEGEKRDKYKKACHLCGTKTLGICMQCHCPTCNVNRDQKLMELIYKGDKKVAFLDGKRPSATIKFECCNESDGTKTFYTVSNSCHHILHQNSKSSL